MSLDSALDFAMDQYLAGNLRINPASDSTPAQVEALLAPWNVTVTA
jgi:hypothetical protein